MADIQTKIKKLETELAELKRIASKPKSGGYVVDHSSVLVVQFGRLGFKSNDAMRAYVDAFKVILELHKLSDWCGGDIVWTHYGTNTGLKTDFWGDGILNHSFTIFGRFATQESAQKSIDTVGKERIERAIKVLGGQEI